MFVYKNNRFLVEDGLIMYGNCQGFASHTLLNNAKSILLYS